jgi:hypothetical protein
MKELNLIGVLRNSKGGWNVKTTLPKEQLHLFTKRGSGLYLWVTESEYKLILQNPKKKHPHKFGQFGTNAIGGITPQETINGYINEPVVILWALHFGVYEYTRGTPYDIEQIVNKRIGKLVKDGKGRETFMTTVEIVKREVSSVLYGDSGRTLTYQPRPRQSEFRNKFVQHRLNGGTQFLLGAIMRYGKNFAWLESNYQLLQKGFLKKGDVLLVITSKPNVFSTLKDDLTKHVYFKDFDFVLMKNSRDSEPIEFNPEKITVVAVSTQLAYNKSRKKMRHFLSSLNFRDVFVDECHSGVDTEKFNTLMGELSVEHTTFVSGTPYKTNINRGFTPETSYFYGYVEQQVDKWNDINSGIPNDSVTLKTYIPYVDPAYRNNPIYTDSEQFTTTKLFSINSDGTFVHDGDATDFLSDVLGKSNKKSKYSPFRICGNLNHTIWLLPDSVAIVKAVAKAIRKIAPEYVVIEASGNETKDIKDVKDAIENNEKTITLTIGRFVEGTTVKEWNGCLVFSDTESLEKYFQFIFRVATPDVGKDTAYVFDFSPERTFQMVFEISNAQASNQNRTDSQTVIKQWLDCNNVYRMGDGPQPVEVQVGDVLQQINNGDYRAITLKKKYDDWLDLEGLVTLNTDMLNVLKGLGSYTKSVVSSQMNTNDMGGGKNYTLRGLKRELTKSEKNDIHTIIKNIAGMVAPLPLLAEVYGENTVEGILDNVPPKSLMEACKVDRSIFDFLIQKNIINPRQINYFL